MRTVRCLFPLWLAACASQGSPSASDGLHAATTSSSDADADGWSLDEGDCDDARDDVHPGAADPIGDGVDQDCDGADGADADGDGFASLASGGDDCDDTDAALHPADLDGDGASTCDGDCDDAVAEVRPGLAEVCDGLDNDCLAGVDVDQAGVDVCVIVEAFRQGSRADILFVVDNSCSMGDEQALLASNAAALIAPLHTTDFHVGVVSTDMHDPAGSGKLQMQAGALWIDGTWAQVDAEAWFAGAIQLGTGGIGAEKGLDAARTALDGSATAFNAGFVRTDAAVHVVVLTDEDDASSVSPADFFTWFSSWKGDPSLAVFHSIVSPDPPCAGASPGTAYLDVSAATGGAVGSICAPNLGPIVADIADQVVLTGPPVVPVYALSEAPDPATLVVVATPPDGVAVVLAAEDFAYDPVDDTIEILGDWELGTTFRVSYRRA